MHLALRASVLVAVILLSACGGGGGGGEPAVGPGAGAAPQGATLSGVVAVGAPLTRAEVKSWCGDGSAGPTATTDDNGGYAMALPEGCAAPWFMQATGTNPADPPLYSFGGDPSAGPLHTLNITSLTSILVEIAVDTSDLEAAKRQLRETPRSDLQQLWNNLLPQVNALQAPGLAPMTIEGIFGRKFQPRLGDPMDDLLELWKQHRGPLPASAIREYLQKKGGDLASGKPWKTLFTGDAPLVLSGTSCFTSGPTGVPDATATLRMVGDDLTVEMASSVFGTPRTFIVGPSVRSDFFLGVQGGSPFVRLRALRSGAAGGTFEVFDNAGTPSMTMATGSVFVSCTLAAPIRRDALVGFEPVVRVLSAIPANGASGTCPSFFYSVNSLGKVMLGWGGFLPGDWMEAANDRYSENLQFRLFGSTTPAFQIELVSRGMGIQPYYFAGTNPYGLNCL